MDKLEKKRLLLYISTVCIVTLIATGFILYAKGFKYSPEAGISQQGLFLVKSQPEGASVYINDEETTFTNDTISLLPDEYRVSVEKEGHHKWSKNLTIKKDEVTEITAHLFKSAPSLSALTFNSASNPVPSRDFTNLAYTVLPAEAKLVAISPTEKPGLNNNLETEEKPQPTSLNPEINGLWIIEMVNLPLGFSREARRITDGDLTNASFVWSPNGREILLTIGSLYYLIPTNEFTPERARTILTETQLKNTNLEWQAELDKKTVAQIKTLPDELRPIFENNTSAIVFSPDEDIILYTAKGSAMIPEGIVKPLPGASTQQQSRDIKDGHNYVYDIKEDRNFEIMDNSSIVMIEGGYNNPEANKRLSWYPSSRNLVLAEPNKITIMDMDGTNRQPVYTGSYLSPNAFPTVSLDRLMILTNLGAIDTPENIYSLSVK